MNKQVKDCVLKYVVEHLGVKDIEIAENLGISIVNVTEALLLLEDEGLVKSMD